jgi:hypothetical protein
MVGELEDEKSWQNKITLSPAMSPSEASPSVMMTIAAFLPVVLQVFDQTMQPLMTG